jgi:gliding motility-associated-like protein
MLMLRSLLTPFFLLVALGTASATHIVGGEITYRCLGNNQFEITLTVYRDCYTGVPPFDPLGSIGIFRSDWSLFANVLVPPMGDDTIPIVLTNPCLQIPPNVCVHRTQYQAVVTLPYIAGGYTLVYQRCCRNNLILNIIDPLATGASYISVLSEETLLECNSGATFNSWPPVAICIHEPINFDHGATDLDGDSLVYRLCTPLQGADEQIPQPQPPNPGPYQEVVWVDPPYNLSNVLSGDPLTIDPQTGFMTGIPNMIGNFVVGVCVDEYRDGEIISTTRRDFQYNVADCGQPVSAFFVPQVICDTLTVAFQNQSTAADDFRWYFNYDVGPFEGSFVTSPIYTFADTGRYHVVLVANPDSLCSDTADLYIHLTNSTAAADLDYDYTTCIGNSLVIQATDQSSDPVNGIVAWEWVLHGPGGVVEIDTVANPQFTVSDPGDYELELTVTSGNGCTETLSIPFEPPLPSVGNLDGAHTICPGDTVELFPAADPNYQYTWSPATALSSTTEPNPVAFPAATTTYHVVVTGDGPCMAQGNVSVTVLEPGTVSLMATPNSIIQGDTAVLELSAPAAQSINWTPTAGLLNTDGVVVLARPDTSTTYTAHIVFASGCEAEVSVRISVLPFGCDEPLVFFPTAFSPNADTFNDVLKLESLVASEVYWVIYNRWGEKLFEAFSVDDAWDGTYRGEPQPMETYGYYLEVKCVGGSELQKKGNITLLR